MTEEEVLNEKEMKKKTDKDKEMRKKKWVKEEDKDEEERKNVLQELFRLTHLIL